MTGPGRPVVAMWNASLKTRAIPRCAYEIMVLGDGPAHLDDRRFLEGVGADDGGADLAGDGDDAARNPSWRRPGR